MTSVGYTAFAPRGVPCTSSELSCVGTQIYYAVWAKLEPSNAYSISSCKHCSGPYDILQCYAIVIQARAHHAIRLYGSLLFISEQIGAGWPERQCELANYPRLDRYWRSRRTNMCSRHSIAGRGVQYPGTDVGPCVRWPQADQLRICGFIFQDLRPVCDSFLLCPVIHKFVKLYLPSSFFFCIHASWCLLWSLIYDLPCTTILNSEKCVLLEKKKKRLSTCSNMFSDFLSVTHY